MTNFTGWISSREKEEDLLQASATGVFVTMQQAAGVPKMPDELEAALREKMVAKHPKWDAENSWDHELIEELVYGERLWTQQPNGNCVGSSAALALASRIAYEIMAGHPEQVLGPGGAWGTDSSTPFVPYVYGVGRHEGGFRGNGDGSACTPQFDGLLKYGFLPCSEGLANEYGGKLPQSTSGTNKKFGRSFAACQEHLNDAKPYSLDESPVIRTAEDLFENLCKLRYPAGIASNWGFREWKTDSNGVKLYKKSGSWSHQMHITRAFTIGGQRYFRVRNQWGQTNHSGDSGFDILYETAEDWSRSWTARGVGAITIPQISNPGA